MISKLALLKAGYVCLTLLSPDTPICGDGKDKLYLCLKDRCATIQQMSVEWKRHPGKQAEYLKEMYGAKE